MPFSFLVVLNQNATGGVPDADTALNYASQADITTLPVMSDHTQRIVIATPWNGTLRPGKCALAPDMTILTCWDGTDNQPGFDAIKAHAGLSP